jgi:hypothetical protein
VTRATSAVGTAALVAGFGTGVVAVGSWTNRVTGRWAETLIVVGVVIVCLTVGWIVIVAVTTALIEGISFVFTPAQPPALVRIVTLIAEQQATAAGAPDTASPGDGEPSAT